MVYYKKGALTIILTAVLLAAVCASFGLILIYSDHAGYSTTGSNLGDIDYDEIISNAKKAGYKVDGPYYVNTKDTIGVPLVVDLPSSAADILTPKSAGICYSIGIVMMGSLFMPLLTVTIFYKDRVTSMPVMIISQPVSPDHATTGLQVRGIHGAGGWVGKCIFHVERWCVSFKWRYFQIFANLLCKDIVDFSMSWNSGRLLV